MEMYLCALCIEKEIIASVVHVAGAWMSAARQYLTTLMDDGLSTELSPLSTAINCSGIF